jgi:hypothetical protein
MGGERLWVRKEVDGSRDILNKDYPTVRVQIH